MAPGMERSKKKKKKDLDKRNRMGTSVDSSELCSFCTNFLISHDCPQGSPLPAPLSRYANGKKKGKQERRNLPLITLCPLYVEMKISLKLPPDF